MRNVLYIIIVLLLAFQLIQIDKINPKTNKELEIQAPEDIMTIFKKACYDCHSNETVWPWYSSIAPMSWSIYAHVDDGRKWLNFSIWETYSKEEQDKKMKELFRAIYIAMPPSDYIYFHDEASLTKDERTRVRDWTGVMK